MQLYIKIRNRNSDTGLGFDIGNKGYNIWALDS